MIISNMKPNTVVLKEFLYDLKQKVDPKLRCNEIEVRELDKVIKIYNIQENCYIPLETLEELLWIYMNIQKNAQISNFIREMLNVFKSYDGRQELELLKIDQLTENIFALIGKKYTEISKTEDASLFNRIDMAKGKVLENEYPFDKAYVQEDFSNILNNIYAANNFIDLHGEGGNDEILYKKHCGRGRNKTKTVNIKERPFVCEYPECKRAFKRFEHLKRHNKMHTGERPYKCKFPGCMKSFSRSDNLSQHFKIHNVSVKSQSLRFKNYYETHRDVE